MKETRQAARLMMAAGWLPTFCLCACAARPAAPAPAAVRLLIAQPFQPIVTPTPIGHLLKVSWYGPGLAGRKTSSGERFNPRALTAASKTLPIGSVISVTNPRTGKSVKVRINDRGPFVPRRSLDLSRRAAEKIGIIREGVAAVKVTTTTPSQADVSSDYAKNRGMI
jgi:rare lipoprotein A